MAKHADDGLYTGAKRLKTLLACEATDRHIGTVSARAMMAKRSQTYKSQRPAGMPRFLDLCEGSAVNYG